MVKISIKTPRPFVSTLYPLSRAIGRSVKYTVYSILSRKKGIIRYGKKGEHKASDLKNLLQSHARKNKWGESISKTLFSCLNAAGSTTAVFVGELDLVVWPTLVISLASCIVIVTISNHPTPFRQGTTTSTS